MFVWDLNGNVMASVLAHEGYIYSVDSYESTIATGGEDGTVRLWSMGKGRISPLQCIPIPAESVWCVRITDGWMFCGASDGRMYVFSSKISIETNMHYLSRLSEVTFSPKVLTEAVRIQDRKNIPSSPLLRPN